MSEPNNPPWQIERLAAKVERIEIPCIRRLTVVDSKATV